MAVDVSGNSYSMTFRMPYREILEGVNVFNLGEKITPRAFGDASTRMVHGVAPGITTEAVFAAKFVNDVEDLYNALRFDAQATFSSMSFGAEAQLGIKQEQLRSARSSTYVANAYWAYGDEIPAVNVIPLLRVTRANFANNYSGFTAKYGTHYVAAYRRAASLSAVVSVNNIEGTSRKELSAKLSAHVGSFASSFKLAAAFESVVSEVSKHGSLEIRLVTMGGNGPKLISDTMSIAKDANATQISSLADKFSEFIKNVTTAEFAVPHTYFLSSYASLFESPNLPDPQTQKLFELSRMYAKAVKINQVLDEVARGVGGQGAFYYLTDQERALVLHRRQEIRDRLALIGQMVDERMRTGKLKQLPRELPPLVVPSATLIFNKLVQDDGNHIFKAQIYTHPSRIAGTKLYRSGELIATASIASVQAVKDPITGGEIRVGSCHYEISDGQLARFGANISASRDNKRLYTVVAEGSDGSPVVSHQLGPVEGTSSVNDSVFT